MSLFSQIFLASLLVGTDIKISRRTLSCRKNVMLLSVAELVLMLDHSLRTAYSMKIVFVRRKNAVCSEMSKTVLQSDGDLFLEYFDC